MKREAPDAQPNVQHNKWSTLSLFISESSKLIGNGLIWPLIFLVIIITILIVAARLPESALAVAVQTILSEVIVSKGWLIAALAGSNAAWPALMMWQRRRYEDEIERLRRVRKALLHNPEQRGIKEHRSTQGEIKETYMLLNVGDKE